VKSRLLFWRKEVIEIPSESNGLPVDSSLDEAGDDAQQPAFGDDSHLFRDDEVVSERKAFFPSGSGWVVSRVLIILITALVAQRSLEPPGRSAAVGLVLYLIATAWLVWSNLRGEWVLPPHQEAGSNNIPFSFRPPGAWLALVFSLAAFLMFGGNLFTPANLFVWSLALGSFVYAFWVPNPDSLPWWQRFQNTWARFKAGGLILSPWRLLVIGVLGIAAFYRFYLLDQVPAEMFSDHAEKLLDVRNVLYGQTNIFFPRNTGREALQMYLTAAMALVFKTGLSFLSLKLGTAICGALTLPFIYLLGLEVANQRTGLLAMFFAGIAYWPNVISRVALRFTLYPTFTAPMLYFLVRGLKRKSRNDFIWSGIFLGIGLHGYSPYRFVPLVVVLAILIYIVHQRSKEARRGAFMGLVMVGFSSLIVFLPLLRYALSDPATFSYRMMTRMGQAERPFPGSPVGIFFGNLWKTLLMPVWDNGQIWVHSIPMRPALGVVAAVFFVLGCVLLIIRYVKKRHWLDLFLLASIPLLMMPSILSIAFPDENPSLNRTGGALVVVFLIAGLAFDGMLAVLKSRRLSPGGTWLAWGVAGLLLFWSGNQNYDLVFNQYANQFKTNAWNTSELGAIIRQFADSAGAEDSAWVIPYPHWVDTRLVGIRAGFPERDYALWRENIVDTVSDPRPKLYLVKPEDGETISLLRGFYPTGVLRLYESQSEGRDFYMYSVPPVE
jgi:hypothetical protein